MPLSGVGIVFEGKDLAVSVVFVKCGSLKGKGVHKRVSAAALQGFAFRRRQQPASDPLAPEPFADEKVLDAEPVAKGLSGQSGQLLARPVLKEYADGNTLGCLTVAVIVFPQHLMDLMDIAFVSVVRDSDIHMLIHQPYIDFSTAFSAAFLSGPGYRPPL